MIASFFIKRLEVICIFMLIYNCSFLAQSSNERIQNQTHPYTK